MSHRIRSNFGVFTIAYRIVWGVRAKSKDRFQVFVRELRIIHELAAPGEARWERRI